ncbi:phosphatase and tensin, putative, partial [Ichthyophthirius multifiliis]
NIKTQLKKVSLFKIQLQSTFLVRLNRIKTQQDMSEFNIFNSEDFKYQKFNQTDQSQEYRRANTDQLEFNDSDVYTSDEDDCDFSDDNNRYYFDEDDHQHNQTQFQKEQLQLQINKSNLEKIQKEAKDVEYKIQNSIKQKEIGFRNIFKLLVSKKKKRFDYDGYSLDLTYITERIIAMGFPAENYEKMYRNSMSDVQKFFNNRHKAHYKIYNLCSERKYDIQAFGGMVAQYPFDDHQAPSLQLIYRFCKDLDQWLNANSNNVAGIHCKAGKGRTGVMICCYLMYSKQHGTAIDALRYYGMMRTQNKKGVTIPSQIRYVLYFEKILLSKWKLDQIPDIEIRLTKIKLLTVPNFGILGGCQPFFTITCKLKNVKYFSKDFIKIQNYKNEAYIEFIIDEIKVKGDVQIQFFHKALLKKKQKMFQFWFNTAFFEQNGVIVIDKH